MKTYKMTAEKALREHTHVDVIQRYKMCEIEPLLVGVLANHLVEKYNGNSTERDEFFYFLSANQNSQNTLFETLAYYFNGIPQF